MKQKFGRIAKFIGSKKHALNIVSILVRRELKVKYRGTILGYIWSMLSPLMFMGILAFVFGHLVRGVPNYEIFVLSGILAWNLVSQSIEIGTHSIVSNAPLLKKVAVPIWVFPMVPLGSTAINLMLSMVPLSIIMLWKGVSFSGTIWALPFVVFPLIIFVSGIALTLSVANVFFRDVAHVLSPVLSLVFYGTPVIYDRNNPALPTIVSEALLFNPFSHYVEAFRGAIYLGGEHLFQKLLLLYLMAAISFAIGLIVYKTFKARILFSL